jgi:hypothetical protein
MYLHEGIYVKGVMEWCLDNNTWRFRHRQKNGSEILGITLPNFCQDFQKYINDGTIIPGWHTGKMFTLAGSTCHVSATNLTSIAPPGSVIKALHQNNPDHSIWLDSYKEEYDGLSLTIPSTSFLRRNIYVLEGLMVFGQFLQWALLLSNIPMGLPHGQRVKLLSLAILNNTPGQKLTVFLR